MSDLPEQSLVPELMCGGNLYCCARCASLRDADRWVWLLTPPHHLLVSMIWFMFGQRASVRRELLAAVSHGAADGVTGRPATRPEPAVRRHRTRRSLTGRRPLLLILPGGAVARMTLAG